MTQAETKAAKAKPEIESVKMDDGRVTDFVGKRVLVKESAYDKDKGIVQVRLDFRNGETRLFSTSDLELIFRAAAHGFEQKLGDETAGVDDLDDKILAIDDLIERLGKGEWTQKREANSLAGASVLLKALVELTGKTREKIKAFLEGKSAAEKAALRASAQLKPIIAKLEAEKAAKSKTKVDTDALLGELGQETVEGEQAPA